MKLARLALCTLTLATLALAAPASAQERSYPSRPVKVLVPFPPGGSIDVIARAYAVELERALGQAFVVENRPGASGSIATAALAKSPPDGYTLGLTLDGILINYLLAKVPYKIPDDFQPVGTLASIPMMMVVNPKVPANTFQEFVALAKAKPRTQNYASSGNASISHLLMELINVNMGIETTHVPYTGGPPGMTATVAGDVDVILVSAVMGMPQVKAGKLKVLVVGSPKRFTSLPDVPTIAEAGKNPNLTSLGTWTGLQAPAGTPRAIVDKLNAEINRIGKSPEMIDKLEKLGAEPFTGSVEDFARFQREELRRWSELFKTVHVKLE